MAITPPSDIVLDVARAADPEKYRVAAERLARLRATAPSTETFMPPATQARAATPADAANAAATPTRAVDAGASAQSRRRLDPYGQFEAFDCKASFNRVPKRHHGSEGSAGESGVDAVGEDGRELPQRPGRICRRWLSGPSIPFSLQLR